MYANDYVTVIMCEDRALTVLYDDRQVCEVSQWFGEECELAALEEAYERITRDGIEYKDITDPDLMDQALTYWELREDTALMQDLDCHPVPDASWN